MVVDTRISTGIRSSAAIELIGANEDGLFGAAIGAYRGGITVKRFVGSKDSHKGGKSCRELLVAFKN